jgi:hypothetical protein
MRLLPDYGDRTRADGHVGLWTRADPLTEFDDLEVWGAPPK